MNELAVIHFEIFNRPEYNGVDTIHVRQLQGYLKDEELSYGPAGTAASSSLHGVAIRPSLEHGFLWFPVKEPWVSFHVAEGIVFGLRSRATMYDAWLLPFLDLMTRAPNGVHAVDEDVLSQILDSGMLRASANKPETLVRLVEGALSSLFGKTRSIGR
jgi:hypothetical protein